MNPPSLAAAFLLPLFLAWTPLATAQSAADTIDTEDLLARFCRYVEIDTTSASNATTVPSSPGQWDLLRLLEQELREIGATEITLTEHGILLATIPPTVAGSETPVVAWLAHVDTAPELPGAAKPIVHRAYAGAPIVLPDDTDQILDPAEDPDLRAAIGHDVITASGKTLLGADDKAGVAAIMGAARHLLRHPEILHGRIRLVFTPDEEVVPGGAAKLDLGQLGANVGYTLDAGRRGEINFETFSADLAEVEIQGVSLHPGWAKGKMVNAARLAARFLEALPMDASPERTAGRDGFIHPARFSGNVEHATIRLILRDFELEGLAAKRTLLERLAAEIRAAEPRAGVSISFTEQYRNMRYCLEKDMRPVTLALEAMRRAGIQPVATPLRGGTDGAHLTARGLPTPNLFAGWHSIHSVREWVSLQDIALAAQMLVHLAGAWTEPSLQPAPSAPTERPAVELSLTIPDADRAARAAEPHRRLFMIDTHLDTPIVAAR